MRKIALYLINRACASLGFLAFRLSGFPPNFSMVIGGGPRGNIMVIPRESLVEANERVDHIIGVLKSQQTQDERQSQQPQAERPRLH